MEELVIDVEKALSEKRAMQKEFIEEHGFPNSVLILVIAHLEEMKKKQ